MTRYLVHTLPARVARYLPPQVRFEAKLKLVMLYALRYELDKNQTPQLKRILREKCATNDQERARVQAVDEVRSAVLSHCLCHPMSGPPAADLAHFFLVHLHANAAPQNNRFCAWPG